MAVDRDEAQRRVDALRGELVRLSHAVHGDAETRFEEHTSSRRVADALDGHGFDVDFGVCDLETAFVARAGSGALNIGICAEYDALPGIGHACGHNIIAAAAVGAGVALAGVADELDLTVTVLGTPGEEGGGGKILMLDRGGFDGLHAAMMVHPAPYEASYMPCLAVQPLVVDYRGHSAHAAAFPEQGVNAADALTVAQVAVGLLRQHFRGEDRVHGIVTDGGDAPNIVPERTSGTWYVRARTLAQLAELQAKVERCFQAGAMATGCEVTISPEGPAYSEFAPDHDLRRAYRANGEALGRSFDAEANPEFARVAGSTDMANVSLVMPTIHPMLAIESGGAVNHQPEFAAACVTASADQAVRDGALAMAMTAVDAATDATLRERLLATTHGASR